MLLLLNAPQLWVNTERAVSTCERWQIENVNVCLYSWRWCQMKGQEGKNDQKNNEIGCPGGCCRCRNTV